LNRLSLFSQIFLDDRKRKEQHRSILYRQYRAQLLRRSHEIEDDLQHDLALLERIKREEIEEAKIKEIKLSEAKIFAQVHLYLQTSVVALMADAFCSIMSK
jgi:hypothetical protein